MSPPTTNMQDAAEAQDAGTATTPDFVHEDNHIPSDADLHILFTLLPTSQPRARDDTPPSTPTTLSPSPIPSPLPPPAPPPEIKPHYNITLPTPPARLNPHWPHVGSVPSDADVPAAWQPKYTAAERHRQGMLMAAVVGVFAAGIVGVVLVSWVQ
ncbi:hypothetical protein IQ07DRAFT_639861 [Pyrenochaeta sp. DS3sAY3a]|nr:hypothetical protein IQ07DRAFT_639861 [Pyrenochaeta sp. DS3sAY3a]